MDPEDIISELWQVIEETLAIAWDLLSMLPESELKRIDTEFIRRYHPHLKEVP